MTEKMTEYELPRTEDGGVDIALCAEWIENGVLSILAEELINAIIANARAETIEACAKLCEEEIERPADYQGRFGGYGNFMGDKTGPECADAIRNMETPK